MGGGRWTSDDWTTYSTAHVTSKSTREIYSSRGINSDLDPKGVQIRESCDSADNPNSTPLIVALDVTGSMSRVLDSMAREGLKNLAQEVYDRKPISDPHIMMMGVGDCHCDDAPLQVTQFEADIRIAEQLAKIYLEQGGGGNDCESYTFPWYFAATHTRIDSFEKRGKKGFLFTMGDEEPNPYIFAADIEKFLGYKPQFDKLSAEELYAMVSRQYEVYHLIIEQGSHFRYGDGNAVKSKWRELLGQRAIPLADYTKMGEVIVSILQVAGGADKEVVAKSWDGTTQLVVAKAIDGIANVNMNTKEGLVRF